MCGWKITCGRRAVPGMLLSAHAAGCLLRLKTDSAISATQSWTTMLHMQSTTQRLQHSSWQEPQCEAPGMKYNLANDSLQGAASVWRKTRDIDDAIVRAECDTSDFVNTAPAGNAQKVHAHRSVLQQPHVAGEVLKIEVLTSVADSQTSHILSAVRRMSGNAAGSLKPSASCCCRSAAHTSSK